MCSESFSYQGLVEHYIRGKLKINPADSKSLGLRPGDKLKISSKDGEAIASVGLDNSVVEGTVVFHSQFVDSISSLLGKGKTDPQTKGIYYKDTFVKVGKA
jgi:formate dehydrogenase major subunit